ncbi:MAG: dephospho-CoA kinase, partial [Elusimicrobiota bacterium]
MTHKKRLILGITGGIASGKSSVMALLSKRGIPVICSDDLAHRCIRKGHPAYKKIVRRFGRSILGSDGEINRRTLGKQVFAHPHLRKQLEQIVHPYVIRALKRFAKQHTG